MKAIIGGTILPVTSKKIEDGVILIENGKIKSLGKKITVPKGAEIIPAKGKFVLPGLIDAHTHLGISEVGIRQEGEDNNEYPEPINPQLRAIDGINPQDKGFEYARCGGVTTVTVAPGSANPIGGVVTAIKTSGKVVDDMVVKERVGIKAAFGENPKRVGHEQKRTPWTRMSTAALLRSGLVRAQNYMKNIEWASKKKEKMPDRDLASESLIPVLKKELPLRVHAHRADDIATAVRVAREFDIDIVIEHGTEAHKIADWLGSMNIPIVTGPALGTPSKIETQSLTFKALKILKDAGILFAIMTDHPVVGIHHLLLCAIMGIREGLDEQSAIEAVTINPAKILGLADRLGSIEAGKDADIIIFSGNPFDVRSRVEKTLINGEIVFDADKSATPF
jgi:imidazolonepropionase-like amidohydrolase